MAKGNNYSCYAVRAGVRPGLYYSWPACAKQVMGYSRARFRGFTHEREAIEWLAQGGIYLNNLKTESSASPTPPPATFDQPVNHGSASSASSARGPFYAVARGRQPGIYHNWDDCREQVDGFSDARYKKFPTLAAAQEFCAVYGGGGHFSLFKSEDFVPDQKASFSDEWARLSRSQGWERGTWQYHKQRASALRNEIETHFFASQSVQLPVVKEEEGQGASTIKKEQHEHAALESVSEFDPQRQEAALELLGFQSMCRAVGKNPGKTKAECEGILKSTLVNIVDLLDACRLGRDTTRLPWSNFAAFKAYTLDPYQDKTIPVKEAKKDPILRCFLQNFSSRSVQNESALRDGWANHAYAPHVYSARPPVAPPQQQCPAQQQHPHPVPNAQSASTPPFVAPQGGGVVIKKRAMSEDDDDIKHGRHQEKKAKVEEAQAIKSEKKAKVEVTEGRVTRAQALKAAKAKVEDVIEARVTRAQVIKAEEVTHADHVTHADVVQVDDVIVVKEVKVKREQDEEAKKQRRLEMKKIQHRWAPSNSIMRNWISSSV
ncbi:hypothetical protein KVR01_001008 [Diaporthe batatas]|uniref:uncharacterized protein n=1 Tax=Diaporthe batatas TaxID=748121 RepID=UPI001D03DE83|nr:uncharacterized protein KVR01_001008 [Diaporthe batatas]KAG8170263.1 hypothetical protein KVR01_001008 [Diaporthe batatas]